MVRIPGPQLTARMQEITGREVHVVLMDGRTHFGAVQSVGQDKLTLTDGNHRWVRKKGHTHQILTQDVLEVIFDLVTEY